MRKKIIVTGASSGIGKALSEHLASLNYHVIAAARNERLLKELYNKYPHHIEPIVCDLAIKHDWLKIKNALSDEEEGIYLVHNAGIVEPEFLSHITQQDWDRHFLINLKAPVFLTQLLLPNLRNGGRVLNVSTGLAHSVLKAFSAYGISKAGLFMWKEYCNAEFSDQKILFGSVMPGVVDTPIQEKLRAIDTKKNESAELFKKFWQNKELLAPMTVAKFLTWLLFKVDNQSFIKHDWNIYDSSHHKHWALEGEIKPRN